MPHNAQCLTVPSLWIHAVRNAKLHQHRGAKVEVMTFGGLWGINPAPWNPTLCRVLQKQNLGIPTHFLPDSRKQTPWICWRRIFYFFTMLDHHQTTIFEEYFWNFFLSHQTYANLRFLNMQMMNSWMIRIYSPFGNKHVQGSSPSVVLGVYTLDFFTWNLKRSP